MAGKTIKYGTITNNQYREGDYEPASVSESEIAAGESYRNIAQKSGFDAEVIKDCPDRIVWDILDDEGHCKFVVEFK